MNQNFAAIILGGTGQVGGAAVAELLAIPECREVVMVIRKPIAARSLVRNVVLDTGAADFAEHTAALAREVLSQGPVSAVSCVGVGSGSMRWSEEELKRIELGVVGASIELWRHAFVQWRNLCDFHSVFPFLLLQIPFSCKKAQICTLRL
jgi:hypothetical protein